MKPILIAALLCTVCTLAGCSNPEPIETQNFVGSDVTCQNLWGQVTDQTGDYLYIVGSGDGYREESEVFAYSGWQHSSECYREPITKEDKLLEAQMRYDGIFQDDKRFACRQHVTQPIELIHRGQCETFEKVEEDGMGYVYECTIKTSDFSSYPVFCI